MQAFSDNLNIITKKIEQAAKKGGFDGSSVRILAATKSRQIEQICSLLSTGKVDAAGENRVQEFLGKYQPDITFDFIGRLQTNKVKYIIDKVRLIQSVDRENLLSEIDKQAAKHGIIADILIQINSGLEEAKGGIDVADTLSFAEKVQKFANIRLRGIMAVAPIASEVTLRKCFGDVYRAYRSLQKAYANIDYLSMGMSEDYELAVECGSNMIRLGRVLFEGEL